MEQGHDHRLRHPEPQTEQEGNRHQEARSLEQGKQEEGRCCRCQGYREERPRGQPPRDRRQKPPDDEGRHGKRAEHQADARRRQSDARAVDWNRKGKHVPRRGQQPARDKDMTEHAVAQEIDDAAARVRWRRIGVRLREAQLVQSQHGDRQQRKCGECPEGRDVAECVDPESSEHRAHETRYRKSQCRETEGHWAILGPSDVADDVLRGDLVHHEARADQDAGEMKRRQRRPQIGDERAECDRDRSGEHGHSSADAVDQASHADRREHRQQGVQGHQHADRERRRVQVNGIERYRHTHSREHAVVEQGDEDEEIERAHARVSPPGRGTAGKFRQRPISSERFEVYRHSPAHRLVRKRPRGGA